MFYDKDKYLCFGPDTFLLRQSMGSSNESFFLIASGGENVMPLSDISPIK